MQPDKPLLNKNSSPETLSSEESHGFRHLHRFLVKLREAIGWHVPLGYEDESGFHFGVKPGYVVQEPSTETGTQTADSRHPVKTASTPSPDSSQPARRMFLT